MNCKNYVKGSKRKIQFIQHISYTFPLSNRIHFIIFCIYIILTQSVWETNQPILPLHKNKGSVVKKINKQLYFVIGIGQVSPTRLLRRLNLMNCVQIYVIFTILPNIHTHYIIIRERIDIIFAFIIAKLTHPNTPSHP